MTVITRLVTRPEASDEFEWMMTLPQHMAFFYLTYMEDFLRCDELIFLLDEESRDIGVVAIAYNTDTGFSQLRYSATILAVYIVRQHFGCDLELVGLKAGIARCYEKGCVKVYFTPRTTSVRAAINRLPSELKIGLIVHDTGVYDDGLLG